MADEEKKSLFDKALDALTNRDEKKAEEEAKAKAEALAKENEALKAKAEADRLAAEKSPFFAGIGDEFQGALRLEVGFHQDAENIEHGRDSRGIVVGPRRSSAAGGVGVSVRSEEDLPFGKDLPRDRRDNVRLPDTGLEEAVGLHNREPLFSKTVHYPAGHFDAIRVVTESAAE